MSPFLICEHLYTKMYSAETSAKLQPSQFVQFRVGSAESKAGCCIQRRMDSRRAAVGYAAFLLHQIRGATVLLQICYLFRGNTTPGSPYTKPS
jgi:hypothetical protein